MGGPTVEDYLFRSLVFLIKLGQVVIESLGWLLDASADMTSLIDMSTSDDDRWQDTHCVVIPPYVNHNKIFAAEFRIPDEIRDVSALQATHG